MSMMVAEFEALCLKENASEYRLGNDDDRLRLLVRRGGKPIGWAEIPRGDQPTISGEQAAEEVRLRFAEMLDPLPGEVFLTAGKSPTTPISVVVCTRDRTDLLGPCLQALLNLDYPKSEYEVIVVDNASRDDSTKQLAASLPVRYVREDRPGLDWARNCGFANALHGIVAYTDDDARVDRLWLRAIARGFEDPSISAVTGFVAPLELATEAQILFELNYGGMGHGFHPRVFRREQMTDRDRSWSSAIGVGANMAYRREVLREAGGFDVSLDVGTATGGGGDIEMFHRLVSRGYAILYEPSAFIWHQHRRDLDALGRQLFDNGRAFTSYLLTAARNGTLRRGHLARFVARDWIGGWILPRLIKPQGFPRRLTFGELRGIAAGPWCYRSARAKTKRMIAAEETSSSTFAKVSEARESFQ